MPNDQGTYSNQCSVLSNCFVKVVLLHLRDNDQGRQHPSCGHEQRPWPYHIIFIQTYVLLPWGELVNGK